MKRPLGIPAYEDRLTQGVMAGVVNEVYVECFLDCSYGFRPKRRDHDVMRYINQAIMAKKVYYVLEVAIKGVFNNVVNVWLMNLQDMTQKVSDCRYRGGDRIDRQ